MRVNLVNGNPTLRIGVEAQTGSKASLEIFNFPSFATDLRSVVTIKGTGNAVALDGPSILSGWVEGTRRSRVAIYNNPFGVADKISHHRYLRQESDPAGIIEDFCSADYIRYLATPSN